MSNYLTLADLTVRCDVPLWPEAELFAAPKTENASPVLWISAEKEPPACHGLGFAPDLTERVLFGPGETRQALCADSKWENARILENGGEDPDHTLVLGAVCSRFACFDTLLLHASLVEFSGQGIVFTGYSGIGKTTQARLWNRFAGADIVNGDKVLLGRRDGRWYAYGLPWKGSSPYCLNRKLPLRAVVRLEKSGENTLSVPDVPEILSDFLPHVFLPAWDRGCVDAALKSFDLLTAEAELVKLSCRPDGDAVSLLKSRLFPGT